MKTVIISGSIQINSGSQRTAQTIAAVCPKSTIVSLTSFTNLFVGEYVYRATAAGEQRAVIETIIAADALIFVVPTYFKSLPGVLKNFFDLVRERSLYEHKSLAFVASNHKNQDFGARQAREIVLGILEFFETQAVFLPEIGIINPASPDQSVAVRVVAALQILHDAYQPAHTINKEEVSQ